MSMLLSELVKDSNSIETSIISEGSWDDFKGLGEGIDNYLLLSTDVSGVVEQISREFHFSGTSTSNDFISLNGSSDDHDSIVEGSFGFSNELFSTSSDDQSGGLGLEN